MFPHHPDAASLVTAHCVLGSVLLCVKPRVCCFHPYPCLHCCVAIGLTHGDRQFTLLGTFDPLLRTIPRTGFLIFPLPSFHDLLECVEIIRCRLLSKAWHLTHLTEPFHEFGSRAAIAKQQCTSILRLLHGLDFICSSLLGPHLPFHLYIEIH